MLLANDIENEGVYVHASTNTDLMWFSPKWTCGAKNNGTLHGGDCLILGIFRETGGIGLDVYNGAWCDYEEEHLFNFICEALITE